MAGTPIQFSDIAHLSDRETQIWLRAIDSKVLATAMKGARRPVRDQILKTCLSVWLFCWKKKERG